MRRAPQPAGGRRPLPWTLGGAISGLAAIMLIPVVSLLISTATDLVIPTIAASVIASFRSIPVAFAAGLAIGVIESEIGHWVSIGGLPEAVRFALIVVFLILRGGRFRASTLTISTPIGRTRASTSVHPTTTRLT
jgi:branched-subunit amino acid ABC-type transport system permease component